MPREEDRPVQQSVLDRLIDNDRGRSTEIITRMQSIRDLKTAVRRDLEWLLNTRSIAVRPSEALKQLSTSVYLYGLEDVTSMSADDAKSRVRLRAMIERTISVFEPRLSMVQVQEISTAVGGTRQIRFTIHAVLKIDPSPERVSFDTVLDLATGQYAVKGGSGAG